MAQEQPSEERAKALTLTQPILGLPGLQLGPAWVQPNRSTGRLLFLKPSLLSSSFYIFKSQCPSTASLALPPAEAAAVQPVRNGNVQPVQTEELQEAVP